ncbi:MAG: polyprenyl diphosphate synthase [Deltaproteobacteria bacterium]|nr:polyprenyl diphosphate synthase [Deltaproteobacteria bacterium]
MKPELAALQAEVASAEVPRHVGVIMDGNGRWAVARGRPRIEGHREGAESVRAVTRTARRIGCEALTLYAFSSQNWGRPAEEVTGLMVLLQEYCENERDELLENDVRLSAVGELERLPDFVRAPLDALIAATAHCKSMVLTLCLSYGGQEEILAGVRELCRRAAAGKLDPEALDLGVLGAALWTGDLPEPGVLVRTSGEQRISNFLLWGSAYAELVFVETAWPEFREEGFLLAIREFQRRQRRFGLTGEQIEGDLP